MSDEVRYADQRFVGLGSAPATGGDLPPLAGAVLVGCSFVDCNLSEASFRGSHLSDCDFVRCDLSMLDLTDTVLQDVRFDACRLTGNHFDSLKLGAMGVMASFSGCDLSFCSFRHMDLTACAFKDCVTADAEFVRCDLTGVAFDDTDLDRCVFQANDLSRADLRSARNYRVSPHGNTVTGMRVALPEALSLLSELGVDLD